MRTYERTRGLLRSPKLIWDILLNGRYDFSYDQMPVRVPGMSPAKRWNLFKSGGNLIYRRLNPWSMPLHMQFELTNYCTLHCPICPTGTGKRNRPPVAMDVGLFEHLLDQVGPYLLTATLWGWGESLLHPNLTQILHTTRKFPLFTLLSTNGQNLDDDRVINAILDAPPTHLIVALDGLTDETNSIFRIGAKLAPILSGVRRLRDNRQQRGLNAPVLHLRFLVMKHNQHQLPELSNFAAQSGFDFLSLRTLSIIDEESPDSIHMDLVPDLPEFKAYAYESGSRVQRSGFICQQPFWFPSVFADGTLVLCEQDYNAQQSLGVLNDSVAFRDLWFSRHAALVRKRIRDHPETLSFCRNCPYYGRITSDCSVRSAWLNPQSSNPVTGAIFPLLI